MLRRGANHSSCFFSAFQTPSTPRLFEQARLICPPTRSDPHAPVKPVQIAQPRLCALATRLRSLARTYCGSQQNSATSSTGAELVGFKSDIFCPEAGSGHEPSVFIQSSRLTQSGCLVVQDKPSFQMCRNRSLFVLDSNDTDHNKSNLFVPIDYRPDCSEWSLNPPQ